MDIRVVHNQEESRFEAIIDNLLCEADYTLSDNVMHVTHTGVPSSLAGQGIAAAITKSLLEYALTNGIKVNPICPYTAAYMQKHPEYSTLLTTK